MDARCSFCNDTREMNVKFTESNRLQTRISFSMGYHPLIMINYYTKSEKDMLIVKFIESVKYC